MKIDQFIELILRFYFNCSNLNFEERYYVSIVLGNSEFVVAF